MLASLADAVAQRGAVLRVVEARGATRDLLRAEGLEQKIGQIDRFSSVADVIDASRAATGDVEEVAHASLLS